MRTTENSSMTEWKARQNAYHVMSADDDRPDDLTKHEIINVEDRELVADILNHFHVLPLEFRYPSKSYVVAIVYARLLEEYFGGDKMEYLDDPELLFGSDPYFSTYSENKEVYDSILETIGWDFDLNQGTPVHIVPYFVAEFMITCGEMEKWNARNN